MLVGACRLQRGFDGYIGPSRSVSGPDVEESSRDSLEGGAWGDSRAEKPSLAGQLRGRHRPSRHLSVLEDSCDRAGTEEYKRDGVPPDLVVGEPWLRIVDIEWCEQMIAPQGIDRGWIGNVRV
ncbi:hypothetical protein [Nocardia amamiensis]|uniref:hypothetical protein n=1 Tax=Nocardia amamiensis TaxID=404578 RepID=UPI0033CE29D7